MNFKIGDYVSMKDPYQSILKGIVKKIGRKFVHVNWTYGTESWIKRMRPELLEKTEYPLK